jgi:O-antigen ligase
MYLSLSRGAWLALAGGLIVLIAMSPHRGSLLLSVLLIGGGCAVALLRLRTYPGLTNAAPTNAARMSAGHAYGPQLLILVGGIAIGQGIMAAGRRSTTLMRALRRAARPVGLILAGALVLLFVIAYGLRAGTVEGWTEARLNSASRFVTKQWNEFLTPATFTATGTARLGTAKGTRSDLYRLAFDGFEENPLRGDGAGSFAIRFFRYRKVDESVRNAHSLELETLGELGLVGGLMLIAILGSGVAAAVQSRRRPSALNRSQAAAVAAGLTVWVVHSFVDWDWQVPALTGAVLLLAASLYPYGRERSIRRRAEAST